MGSCISAHGARVKAACVRVRAGEPEAVVQYPMPDTSEMDLEQVFRMGIAEAQLAASLQKRDRLAHIHTARELLKIALQRCRPGVERDDDLRTHLYAVLLKLGEDARSLQGLREERRDFQQLDYDAREDSLPGTDHSPVADLAGSRAMDDSVSQSSSDPDSPNRKPRFEFTKQDKDFLLLEGSDEEGDASGGGAAAVPAVGNSSSLLGEQLAEQTDTAYDSQASSESSVRGQTRTSRRNSQLSTVKECSDAGGSPAVRVRRSSNRGSLLERDEEFGCDNAVSSSHAAGSVNLATPQSPATPGGCANIASELKHDDSRMMSEEDAAAEDRGLALGDKQQTPRADVAVGGVATPSPGHTVPVAKGLGRRTSMDPQSPAMPSPPSRAAVGTSPIDQAIGPASVGWPPAASSSAWPTTSTSAPAGGGAGNGGWPSPQWSAAGACGSPQWPNATASSASPEWPPAAPGPGPCPTSTADGDKEQHYQRNLRGVQPQQLAHLNAKQRRRGSSNVVLGMSSVGVAGGSSSSSAGATPEQPRAVVRHTGRQPSQSSSSGSQGGMSDSDQSSVGNIKRAHPPFAAAIQEEPPLFAPPARGGADSSDRCEASAEEKPVKSKGTGVATKGGSHSIVVAAASFVRGGHSRTSSAQSDVGARDGTAPWGTPNHKHMQHMTPAMDGAVPSSAPNMEKATPSADAEVQNPLFAHCRTPSGGAGLSGLASPGVHSRISSFDELSLAGSCVPSAAPSPFCGGATPQPMGATPLAAHLRPGSFLTPSMSSAAPSSAADIISVRVLNGVSGEEEVRFAMSLQSSNSEQHFLSLLDERCKQKTGHYLGDLNWLYKAEEEVGARYQRRNCDVRMVEDIFSPSRQLKTGPTVLLLCTVPQRPPTELPAGKVRLKNLTPARVTFGQVQPVRMLLDTSPIDGEHGYSVAFTHQWTNQTYTAEATPLKNKKGVELSLPWQMLTESTNTQDGLYDVHLIIDRSSRSENRRSLTVVSAESELSSSSATRSMSDGFEAIS